MRGTAGWGFSLRSAVSWAEGYATIFSGRNDSVSDSYLVGCLEERSQSFFPLFPVLLLQCQVEMYTYSTTNTPNPTLKHLLELFGRPIDFSQKQASSGERRNGFLARHREGWNCETSLLHAGASRLLTSSNCCASYGRRRCDSTAPDVVRCSSSWSWSW